MTTPRLISLDVTYLVTEALLLHDPERSQPAPARDDDESGAAAEM